MIDDAFMRSLRDQSFELSNQIYRFNFCLSSYIHPTHASHAIGTDNQDVLKALFTSKRLETRLSRRLMKKYDLTGDYFFNFSKFEDRIALMDPESLMTVCKVTGLALNFSLLASYVTKADVARLVEQVGQAGYELASANRQDFAEFNEGANTRSLEEIIAKAEKDGRCCFSEWLYGKPMSVRKRTILKYPKDLQYFRNPKAVRYVPLFVKIAREYVPEWLLKEW